jgi:hypothetical protein
VLSERSQREEARGPECLLGYKNPGTDHEAARTQTVGFGADDAPDLNLDVPDPQPVTDGYSQPAEEGRLDYGSIPMD